MSKKFYTKFTCILLIAVVFVLHANLMAQSGWYPLQSGTSTVLNSVYFLNDNTGYMAGSGIILKTYNGGNNWIVISNYFGGTSIHFADENTGYVCDGTVLKTTDGGVSWVNFNLTGLIDVYFINSNTGFAVGRNSQILRTYNGGILWEPLFVSLFNSNFNSVKFIDSQTGFVVGGRMFEPYFGVIYKTTNGGSTWVLINSEATNIEFRSIDFPTPSVGFAVGGDMYASSGVIYKTTNAGETWVQQGTVYRDLNAINFATPLIGYSVGEGGVIFKTTNGSIVWNLQNSNTSLDINSVYFVGEILGYIAGASGSVQKTINGGVSGPPFAVSGKILYQNGIPVPSGHVKALRYNRASDIIEVVDSAAIQPNGDYLLPGIPQDSVDIMVYPDDEDNLVPTFVPTYHAVNNSGTIYWTQSRTLYVNNNIFNVDVRVFGINGPAGSGEISGGVYSAPPSNGLKDAFVYAMIGNDFKGFGMSLTGGAYDANNLPQGSYRLICDRMGYRSAERYEILGSSNLDSINFYLVNINVIGIEPNGTQIPSSYKLEQNYPNPFNPVTNIKMDIPKAANVRLIIYDMLGREIEILINQQLNAGSYRLSWNAVKYSSGIYFYRIIASEPSSGSGQVFTDTRKMILVK